MKFVVKESGFRFSKQFFWSVLFLESLLALAKARAFCRGRDYVDFSDIEKFLPYVLRHRLLLNSRALTENLIPETLIERLLGIVKAY